MVPNKEVVHSWETNYTSKSKFVFLLLFVSKFIYFYLLYINYIDRTYVQVFMIVVWVIFVAGVDNKIHFTIKTNTNL